MSWRHEPQDNISNNTHQRNIKSSAWCVVEDECYQSVPGGYNLETLTLSLSGGNKKDEHLPPDNTLAILDLHSPKKQHVIEDVIVLLPELFFEVNSQWMTAYRSYTSLVKHCTIRYNQSVMKRFIPYQQVHVVIGADSSDNKIMKRCSTSFNKWRVDIRKNEISTPRNTCLKHCTTCERRRECEWQHVKVNRCWF